MTREPLVVLFTFNMTTKEKAMLEQLADERGATMTGVLRKLIRDEVSRQQVQRREGGVEK